MKNTTARAHNRIAPFLGFSLALLLAAGDARAQVATTGSIGGRVVDKVSGGALPGVTVVVAGPQGEQSTLTDQDGAYTMTSLPVGTYVVRFFLGDAKVEQQNVVVSVDKNVRLNVRMPPLGVSETITITERATAIDTGSTRVGTTIGEDFTRNVPTGRTFGDVLTKAPGAFNDPTGVSLAGGTGLENSYIMDGINVTSVGYGNLGSTLVNDFVQETEVISGGYNAEYGRALGGVVNVVTKSGSNEFHGSLFSFYSPHWLTGNSKVAHSRATSLVGVNRPDYAVDMGAEVGGPIIKNRLFFWLGYSPSFTKSHLVRIAGAFRDADGDGVPDSESPGGPVAVDELARTRHEGSSSGHSANAKVTFMPAPDHSLAVSYYGNFARANAVAGANADPDSVRLRTISNTNDASARWVSKLFDKKWQLEANLAIHAEYDSTDSPDDVNNNALNGVRWANNPSINKFYPGIGVDASGVDRCALRPADSMTGASAFNPCPVQNYQSGGLGYLDYTTANRLAGQLKSTHHLRAGGHHQIKYGLDYELDRYDDKRGYSGPDGARGFQIMGAGYAYTANFFSYPKGKHGYQFQDYQPADSTTTPPRPINADPNGDGVLSELFGPGYYQDFIHPVTQTQNVAGFVQDSFMILPNLTLDVGARLESQRISDFAGSSAITIDDNFAPRIGLIYDPTSEGRAKIYGHWGRFYESIPMDINNRSFGSEGTLLTVWGTPSMGICSTPFANWGAGDPKEGWRSCDPTRIPNDPKALDTGISGFLPLGGDNALVQKDLKGQYTDEVILGGQYEIFRDMTFGASFINRRLGRIIEDSSGDNAVTYVISNPGEIPDSLIKSLEEDARTAADKAAATKAPEDVAAAGTAKALYENLKEIKTYPSPRRDYNALQLTANKRFGHRWMLHASYTYARTVGNYTGLFAADNGQGDPNITSQYDLKELLLNREGPLPTDRPHIGRVDGYYSQDLGAGNVTVGLGYQARSGAPLNYQGNHLAYGRREVFILPRGAGGRVPVFTQVDAHVGYRRNLARGASVEAFVDVFNLLNQKESAAIDSEYTLSYVNAIVDGDERDMAHLKDTNGEAIVVNPNFKNTTAYQAPIAGRMGLRLSF